MRYTALLLPAVALLLAGCASAPPAILTADYPRERAEIQRRLDQIIDAVEKKDLPRLDSYHLYGPKFTKYATEAPGRQDAAAARQGEHDGISAATDLVMRAEEVKIDVFGDVGVATLILRYGLKAAAGPTEKQVRSTLVFVKDHGDWKIVHEHLSVPKPSA